MRKKEQTREKQIRKIMEKIEKRLYYVNTKNTHDFFKFYEKDIANSNNNKFFDIKDFEKELKHDLELILSEMVKARMEIFLKSFIYNKLTEKSPEAKEYCRLLGECYILFLEELPEIIDKIIKKAEKKLIPLI